MLLNPLPSFRTAARSLTWLRAAMYCIAGVWMVGCASQVAQKINSPDQNHDNTVTSRPATTTAPCSPILSGGERAWSGLVNLVTGDRQYASDPKVAYLLFVMWLLEHLDNRAGKRRYHKREIERIKSGSETRKLKGAK